MSTTIEVTDIGPERHTIYVTRYVGPHRDGADRTRIAFTWRDQHSTHSLDMTAGEARRLIDVIAKLLVRV